MTRQEFIAYIAPYAIANHANGDFFPSVIIAQACLESAYGTSELAENGKNLFGITAVNGWTGDTYTIGSYTYRAYPSWGDSISDHRDFVQTARYAATRAATNYYDATVALQASGYAEDPLYGSKLRDIIEYYNLDNYDDDSPPNGEGYIKRVDIIVSVRKRRRRR